MNLQTEADDVLTTWTAVFPLSAGPVQQVRRLVGPDPSEARVRAAAEDYVQAITAHLPTGMRLAPDGVLRGQSSHDPSPEDMLFDSVLRTDLLSIADRHKLI